jgi:3-hydroxy-3-methylglutaryl CoA synthase
MVGISSVGAYIPRYRLSRKEIGSMWGLRSAEGDKAVAGYDEDAVTMAVAAALDCMKRNTEKVSGLYFATTSSPYREKQSAAIMAGALDLDRHCHTADFANSLRAGSIALKAAMDAVKSGSAEQMLVTASDCRVSAPKGRFEPTLGDGAAALMIGSTDLVASLEGVYSIFSDFTDLWRTQDDAFLQYGESRFIDESGYMPVMREAIAELMKRYSLAPADFSKVAFYAHNQRAHAALAKTLGFDKSQIQDPLLDRIGNAGAAAALLTLVSALEEAAPGDRILFATYGDGCDAFIFRVTEGIARLRSMPAIEERLSRTARVAYGKYLEWRDLIAVEAPSLPERPEPSLASRWRERKTVSCLYGFRCKKCGTPQIHPNGQIVRICVACQAKDGFESYKFSDKTGKLFTYAVDHLQPTKNPPGLNGVIDFDGGGRLVCELTDYDLETARVGMPVEMTFRKLSQGKGIVNYFWKAKPKLPPQRAKTGRAGDPGERLA